MILSLAVLLLGVYSVPTVVKGIDGSELFSNEGGAWKETPSHEKHKALNILRLIKPLSLWNT
jgi:hypothetical protein